MVTLRDIKELSNNIVEELYSLYKSPNYKFKDLLKNPIKERAEIYDIILKTFKSQIFIFENEVLFSLFSENIDFQIRTRTLIF